MSFRMFAATLPVAALLFAGISTAPAAQSSPQQPLNFKLVRGTVSPKAAVPDSIDPQRIIFRFNASRSTPLSIRVVNLAKGRTVRRILTGTKRPGRWVAQNWNGNDNKGRLVAAGKYQVLVGPVGGPLRKLSRIRLHGHLFPIDGTHGSRGYIGEFGAPRNGGRTHEGFDATAACGTPLVALRSGTIIKVASDPALKGNYVVLKGRSERRTYLYAHLKSPAPVRTGQKVKAGRRIGTVGQTGNAISTPCHLHIEVRSRGQLLDPSPLLQSWDW
ncbi:MAG: peptidoglycan DD-metalloendopeptidase family protein [Solirubrobacterales bacterium]